MRKKTNSLPARLFTALILMFLTTALFAQKKVTGTVLNSKDNTPVSGASVVVKGTTVGTTTSPTGTFTINVPSGNKTLVISYVGFTDYETDISATDNVSVTLKESNFSLDEIVVTGYTTQKKKDITGAVAVVSVSDAKKIPATSSEQLLQGQAAGVTVINSGAPGAPSTVFVRGISNFGQTQPLYVVDGVQVGDMSTVNPNDIASISVLKDAGSAAIYGISGGNGVVVVTTKRGASGKAKINYDAFFGSQQPLSGNVWHLMNPTQQSELAFRAGDAATEGLYPGGPGVIPTYGYHGGSSIGSTFSDAGVTNNDSILQAYRFDAANPGNDFLVQRFSTTGTDWFHEVFNPAFQQQQTLSASGGSEKSTYLFSFNYIDQKGTLLNTYEKRYQARINTTFSIKDHIRVGETGYVTYRENNGGYNGSQQQEGGSIAFTYREMPIIPKYDVGGNYGGGYTGPKGEPLGNSSNPYAIQARQENNEAHIFTIQGNLFAEVDFAKHFTARTSFGGNIFNQYYWNYTFNTYENYESHASPNGSSENEQLYTNWNFTNTVTYKQVFGQHNIQAFGGYEVKKSSGRSFSAFATGYFSLNPDYVQLQFGTPTRAPESFVGQPTTTQSYFGRLDYSYAEKYLLGATVRTDGFSSFYTGHKFGTFPSVSLGWRVSQENFMKGINWLNDLKLRGSYGVAGNNANISGRNAYSTFASGTGISYYGIGGGLSSVSQGFYNNQIGNPNVSWEKDKISNIGIDASLFNHFDFTVEWYKKAISGLLFPLPLPATTGTTGVDVPSVNIGDVQNTGVDISANYHTKVGKDFTFSIGANVTTYKSLIKKLPGSGYFDFGASRDNFIVRNQVGHPIGAFYGYQTIGIYQDTTSAKAGATYSGASAGSFIYKDVNGDGKIDANDRTWLGNPNAKFTYGVNINAGFKGFDLTVVLYGSQGNKDFNYVKYWTNFYSTFQGGKSLDLYNKAAIVENGKVTNPDATLPAASFSQAFGSSIISSFYVEDGSFLKCRVAQIGYTFPSTLLKKVSVDRLRLYIQATNLFTITKYSGLDPELIPSLNVNGNGRNQNAAFGIDYGAYPNNQKQYIVGVNLSF